MSNEAYRPYLYLITPPVIEDLDSFGKELDAALASGQVACVQLRLKEKSDEAITKATEALMPIAHKHEVSFMINDRADLAKELDADGVHLGQSDGDVKEARELLGHEKDIGVTCHDSRHLGFEAGEAGANYVAFGAFYPTETKKSDYRPEPEVLKLWSEGTEIPCVAIGGITADNCAPLVEAGAHFIAVCSAVWNHPEGAAAAVKEFEDIFSKCVEK